MKGKGLLTLGVLSMLSGSPNAHAAGVDPIRTATNEALVEAVSNPSPSTQNGKEILDFEYEKKLQEEQLMDSILNDEGVQELFQEYGEENVKHVIENMIKDKDTQKVIKRALKDKKIKKALEENDKEALAKRVSEILNDFNNRNTRLLVTNISLCLWVLADLKNTKTINTLLKREVIYEGNLKEKEEEYNRKLEEKDKEYERNLKEKEEEYKRKLNQKP